MSSPISPGDVVEIAKSVYELYKKFKDAPKEMNTLCEQLRLFTTLLRHSDNAILQLDYLKTPEGKDLLEILYFHLRKLKKILRQIRNVGKEWERAQEKWYRRAPFVLYTMRAVPDLQADLEHEMHLVESIKTQAFQIGVPAAMKELQATLAKQKQKSKKQDEFTACERRRRKAENVLRKSAGMQPATPIAEQKAQILKALQQSGLEDDEAQKLLEMYMREKELKDAGPVATKDGDTSVKTNKPAQRVKSFPKGNKIQVVVPKKSTKPDDAVKKAKSSSGSDKTDTKSAFSAKQGKDDEKKTEKAKPKPTVTVIQNKGTENKQDTSKESNKPKPKPKVTVIKNSQSDNGKNNPESDGKGSKDPKLTDKAKQKDQKNKTNEPKPEKKKKVQETSGNGKQSNKKKAEENTSKGTKEQESEKKQGKKQDQNKVDAPNPKKPEKNANDSSNKSETQIKQQQGKTTGNKDKKQVKFVIAAAKSTQSEAPKQTTDKKDKKQKKSSIEDLKEGKGSSDGKTKLQQKELDTSSIASPKSDVKKQKDTEKKNTDQKSKSKDQPLTAVA